MSKEKEGGAGNREEKVEVEEEERCYRDSFINDCMLLTKMSTHALEDEASSTAPSISVITEWPTQQLPNILSSPPTLPSLNRLLM